MRWFRLLLLFLVIPMLFISGCQAEITINTNEPNKNNPPSEQQEETQTENEEPGNTDINEDDMTDSEKEHAGKNEEQDQAPENENEAESETSSDPEVEVITSENDVFQVISPKPDQVVDNSFVLKGKARVFEATFQYALEDGHFILAEGVVTADKGAPEWGDFEVDISFEGASSPSAILILYVGSPKDGTLEHELIIPLRLKHFK